MGPCRTRGSGAQRGGEEEESQETAPGAPAARLSFEVALATTRGATLGGGKLCLAHAGSPPTTLQSCSLHKRASSPRHAWVCCESQTEPVREALTPEEASAGSVYSSPLQLTSLVPKETCCPLPAQLTVG